MPSAVSDDSAVTLFIRKYLLFPIFTVCMDASGFIAYYSYTRYPIPMIGELALQYEWLLLVMCACVLIFVMGASVNGSIAGILVDDRYRMSLSRTQFVIWIVVISSAFLVQSMRNTGRDGSTPSLPICVQILLGFVFCTPIVNAFISFMKNAAILRFDRIGKLSRRDFSRNAQFSDLIFGEEIQTNIILTFSRVQFLLINVLSAILYSGSIWISFEHPVGDTLPEVNKTLLYVQAASHSTYLAFKLVPKRRRQL